MSPTLQQSLAEASVHKQAGRVGMAAQIYQSLLQDNPDSIEVLTNWASLAVSVGNIGRAVNLFEKALTIDPAQTTISIQLADLYIAQDIPWRARHICEAALNNSNAIDYDEKVSLLTKLGTSLRMLKRSDEALKYYSQACELKPDNQRLINMGEAHADLNRQKEASTFFRKAIDIAPESTLPHFLLALIHDYKPHDKHIKEMEALLEKYPKNDFDRVRLCMSLGNAYHRIKEYRDAFRYYQEGNKILRGFFDYSIEQDKKKIAHIKAAAKDTNLFKDYKPLSFDTRPIFIVGMPRSGTSLLEQMLAMHPDMETAGETLHLEEMQERHGISFDNYHASLAALDHSKLDAIGKSYVACLKQYASKPNVIEKLPWNFLYIGLIKTLYPNAKVIHIKRNPLDTCVSIYRCWFGTLHPYMYNLEELGEYYGLYEELMGFWHDLYPGFIHDVVYEDIINNPETTIKKALEYCNLPWTPECLAFNKSKRPVLTASVQQVKKPIYKSAVESWKHYEPYIGDLIEMLNRP